MSTALSNIPVDLFPVADPDDDDDQYFIMDLIDDPVATIDRIISFPDHVAPLTFFDEMKITGGTNSLDIYFDRWRNNEQSRSGKISSMTME